MQMLGFVHNPTGAHRRNEINYSISKEKSPDTGWDEQGRCHLHCEISLSGRAATSFLFFPDQLQKSWLFVGPVELWEKASISPLCAAKRGKRSRSAKPIIHKSIGHRCSALPAVRYPIAGLLVRPCCSMLAAIC
jgi:hypothetical protein